MILLVAELYYIRMGRYMSNSKEIKELINKYYNNSLTEFEQAKLIDVLKTEEGINALKEAMDVTAVEAFEDTVKVDAHISREIYAKLNASVKEEKNKAVKARHFYINVAWKVAASLVFLIVSGLTAYQFYKGYQTVTFTTKLGQRETIILPDLTTVTLNGNSTLTYLRNWNNTKTREVTLSGEAFFDVVHNKEKPFLVHTSKIAIKVLGTSFNVRSYQEDENVETTLVKGKVSIQQEAQQNQNEEVVLEPNQKATFSKNSQTITLTEVKAEHDTSWKSGKLVFEDEAFGEIIKEMERWYGVEFTLEDEASSQCHFWAKIERESLKEVLDMFRSTSGLDYIIEGKHVTVKGKLCN